MPAANQFVGYFFLLVFLAFAVGMLANSLLLERKARRAAEGFEADEERSTFFVDMPTMPQHAGVTDHDYWVKKNRSGG
jgi:hypothetical protein